MAIRDHRTFRALYMEEFGALFILGHSPRYTALKAVLWHHPDRATRIFRESGPLSQPTVCVCVRAYTHPTRFATGHVFRE